MRLFFLLVLLWASPCFTQAQPRTDSLLSELLFRHASPALRQILEHPDSFRCQLIYTQIDRDAQNKPHFRHYYFHLDSGLYFNPASTVKLPVALLALEKLNDLKIPGVDKNTTMLIDSSSSGQVTAHTDSTAKHLQPSIAHYIKRVFLISDNDAYNRLYEWVGQQEVNERLWDKGYPQVRIVRRFMPLSEEENRHTGPVRFVRNGKTIYEQPAVRCGLEFDYSRQQLVGKAYLDKDDQLISRPMDFTRHNQLPLPSLQRMLQSVMFPESVPPAERFHLHPDDYRLLYRYMSEYPSESRHPVYDTTEYFDSYTKFFFFKAGKSKIPSYIRSFNKTGWSYGFLTDAAYIVDFRHSVEFMLTGTIYVNRDGVLNDNKYEYEETGYPFFQEAGKIIYEYELQRQRNVKPNLRPFVMDYR